MISIPPIVRVLIVAAALALPAVSPAGAQPCASDCNGSGDVTVDELVRAVNIALGGSALAVCTAADRDGNGGVSVDELVGAVNAALSGCALAPPSASPTTTATPAPTPTGTGPAGGWASLGENVFAGGPVILGGLAVSASGRVAVSYLEGHVGSRTGKLRVSEWNPNGSGWAPLGSALNLSFENAALSIGRRSIAYDRMDRVLVAWLDRASGLLVIQHWEDETETWNHLRGSVSPLNPGGGPQYPGGAVTVDPQLVIDPLSGEPIVTVTSGPFTSVREWTGSDWAPASSLPSTRLVTSNGWLTVLNNGQRLLAVPRFLDETGTQRQVRLYGPNTLDAQYTVDYGPDVLIRSNEGVLVASDGVRPFALTGNATDGPMGVRRLVDSVIGSSWETLGGDTCIRDTFGELHVTPSGLPLIAYLKGVSPSRQLHGLWWDGTDWIDVAQPNDVSVDVVDFAAAVSPGGEPYVALAQRNRNSDNELVVRRLAAVTPSGRAVGECPPAGE